MMQVRIGIFVGLLVAMSILPLGAGERIAMKVSPAVAFAPANLVVRTMVEADAENRTMQIEAESQEFYRSSEIQLDGSNAPRTTTFEFRSLPSGAYLVTATLRGPSGRQRAVAQQQLTIIQGVGQ